MKKRLCTCTGVCVELSRLLSWVQVEQDTQEAEDVLDLAKILLPDCERGGGSCFPQSVDQFGVLYNRKLLDGW